MTIIFEEILVQINNKKKCKSMIRAVITYSSLEIGGKYEEGEQISSVYVRCNYVYMKKPKQMQTNTSLL